MVYLDAGTTTFEIARSLAERFNLTVVTNDFSIIQHLMNRPQLSLFHTGGGWISATTPASATAPPCCCEA